MDSKGTPPSERDGAGERWTQQLQCWHNDVKNWKAYRKAENSKTYIPRILKIELHKWLKSEQKL